ncbi:lytic transglycosylase domain-containing protein [Vibrio harveyi]|nr:lytic transglycosylase domain-containing protein [Vibrio harveyi]
MILESGLILSLAKQCQTDIDPEIISRLIDTESSRRPYVVAIKGSNVAKQPTDKTSAVSSIKQLEKLGFNYSVGLMQINHTNFKRTGLTLDTAFDYCENIKAGASIFKECLDRAKVKFPDSDSSYHIDAAASCYYSGNFEYGFKVEKNYGTSYVQRFNKNLVTNENNNAQMDVVEIHTKDNPRIIREPKKVIKVWDVFGDF